MITEFKTTRGLSATAHAPPIRRAKGASVSGRALATLVLAAGLLTGCALAAVCIEGCRILFAAEPLLTAPQS